MKKKNSNKALKQAKLVRNTWEGMGFIGSPQTRVIPNKKGSGSYKRRDKYGKLERD